MTGRTLGQNLHAELLDPLLLNATKYAAEEKAKWKPGITTIGGSALNTDTINYTGDITAVGAAGAMVSTVPDLLTWGEALLRDRTIVTGATADTAFRIGRGGTGLGVLGFDARQQFCVFAPRGCVAPVDFRAIGGSGLAAGTRTMLLYDKPTDTVLALIVDRDQTPGVDELALDVLRLVATAEAKDAKWRRFSARRPTRFRARCAGRAVEQAERRKITIAATMKTPKTKLSVDDGAAACETFIRLGKHVRPLRDAPSDDDRADRTDREQPRESVRRRAAATTANPDRTARR